MGIVVSLVVGKGVGGTSVGGAAVRGTEVGSILVGGTAVRRTNVGGFCSEFRLESPANWKSEIRWGLVLDASTGFALRIMLGGSLGLSSRHSLGLSLSAFFSLEKHSRASTWLLKR